MVSVMSLGIEWAEKGLVPDPVVRFGIRQLCRERLRREASAALELNDRMQSERLASMRKDSIAVETDAANEQHYEVPPRLFELALGRHRKYSCGYWDDGVDNLDQAEQRMLELYCERAELADGQHILELGCGWGSLTLWMAEHYPNARITAVSNSVQQKETILALATERGLDNIEVITANVAEMTLQQRFDRVVSIEMFEHMRNYQELMRKIQGWLVPGGKLFVHIFCHAQWAYFFDVRDDTDWMAKYFFTGGQMPAADTLLHFQKDLTIEQRWRVSGEHYEKTANAWLENFDARKDEIEQVLQQAYGEQAGVWMQRWRLFFMACAELFGYRQGAEWHVCHYLFTRAAVDDQ
ncbi:MAG: cyclopropane-fatty-acyl-phospholipid synthase [Lysobacteraceae bacterium]|nr:MAG: cyclopropane-fatty-acyl-phospholipid synthase [Xanthomonadaceae bacterium]